MGSEMCIRDRCPLLIAFLSKQEAEQAVFVLIIDRCHCQVYTPFSCAEIYLSLLYNKPGFPAILIFFVVVFLFLEFLHVLLSFHAFCFFHIKYVNVPCQTKVFGVLLLIRILRPATDSSWKTRPSRRRWLRTTSRSCFGASLPALPWSCRTALPYHSIRRPCSPLGRGSVYPASFCRPSSAGHIQQKCRCCRNSPFRKNPSFSYP